MEIQRDQIIGSPFMPPGKLRLGIKDFNEKSFKQIFTMVTQKYTHLPEYDKVIEWIKDNEGKGLCMIGANGRGKTVIGRYIIPHIFAEAHRKIITCVDAEEMNKQLDDLLKKKLLSIDDVGTEERSIIFGAKRWALPEMLDRAEKNRNILILTSNLDAPAFEAKYGIRTRERLRAICKTVIFKGKSLRV